MILLLLLLLLLLVRITQIYEYSRIQLNAFDDLSYSAYIIDPLPSNVLLLLLWFINLSINRLCTG